jgi:hypothetical protein
MALWGVVMTLGSSGCSLGSSGGSFRSSGGSLGVVVALGSTGGSLVVTLDYKPAVLGWNLPIFPVLRWAAIWDGTSL